MAINFPDAPSVNDVYSVGDRSWLWNGTYWEVRATPTQTFSVSDTAPGSPQSGDMWYRSDTSQTLIYYDSTWVEIGHSANIANFLADADADTKIQLEESADDDTIRFDTAGVERMTIGASGDIVISNDLTVDTNTLHVDSTNNRVGIGTTSPETSLNIVTTNKLGATFTGTTDGEGLRVDQSNYTAGNYVSLVEGSYDDGATEPHVRIGAMYDGGGSQLSFGTSNSYASGITNEALAITSEGRVGINDTTPSYALDVTGDINATGDLRIGGTAVGAVQTYTPIWTATGTPPTIGNGTLTGLYAVINNWCVGQIRMVLGSTSSFSGSTEWRWSLPVAATTQLSGNTQTIGSSISINSGVGLYRGITIYIHPTKCGVYAADGTQFSVYGSVPFAWGTNDQITIDFGYEVA